MNNASPVNYKDGIVNEIVPHSNAESSGRPRGLGRVRAWVLAALMALTVAGCRLEMYDQPRYEPLEGSTFFADSQASRQMIAGTVPRNPVWSDRQANFAESSGGRLLGDTLAPGDTSAMARRILGEKVDPRSGNPLPVTRGLLVRGQERYNIFCTPCHGAAGHGDGMIVQRGFPAPPSFHLDRLRQAPDGYYYDVITNGFGRMYSYASRIAPEDRWAIAAYVRALQLSQHAPLQDLPPQEQSKLQGSR